MSYMARIKTNVSDDQVRLRYPDGGLGGGPLMAFIMALEEYCSSRQAQPPVQSWFGELSKHSRSPLCILAQPFLSSWYVGAGDETATGEEHVDWADAQLLLSNCRELLKALQHANMQDAKAWYDPKYTLADLEILSDTLLTVIGRGATKVKIVVA